jgi:hypothetical protein
LIALAGEHQVNLALGHNRRTPSSEAVLSQSQGTMALKEYPAKLINNNGYWYVTSELGQIEIDTETEIELELAEKTKRG